MIIGAILLAGLGLWIGLGPIAGHSLKRLDIAPIGPKPGAVTGKYLPILVLVVALGIWLLGRGLAFLGVAAAIAGCTLAYLARATALARRVQRREAETAKAASTISLLLRAGQLPNAAISEAALESPGLAPAATAAALGADVATALLAAAKEPGRGGLAELAAAWRVSQSVGAPIAELLAQVAATLRQEQELADIVETELSAARSSSRIMAVLPAIGIGLGMAAGANPIGFLFGGGIGELCFVAGVGLAAVGVVWTERLAAKAKSGSRK